MGLSVPRRRIRIVHTLAMRFADPAMLQIDEVDLGRLCDVDGWIGSGSQKLKASQM